MPVASTSPSNPKCKSAMHICDLSSATARPLPYSTISAQHVAHRPRVTSQPDKAQKPPLDHPSRQEPGHGQRRRNHIPTVEHDQQCLDVIEEHGPADVVGRA